MGAKVKWQWVVCVSFYAPEKIICAWMGGGGSGRLRRAFPIVSKEVGNTWDRETRPQTHLCQVRGIAIGIEIPSVSFEQRTKEASSNQWVVVCC